MEACLLFCLRPSHRDNRPPARLYSYYCPHQALMKIYLHKYKILSIVLPFESNRFNNSSQKHNSVSSQLFSQDANSEEKEKSNYWEMLDTPPAVMVAAANSVLATASSLEAHNCCNAPSLSFLAKPPQQFKLLQYLRGMRMIHQGKPFYVSYISPIFQLVQRLVNIYMKRSEVLLVNPNMILTLIFFSFEGWSLVLCTWKQFVK